MDPSPVSSSSGHSAHIKQQALQLGFHKVGVAAVTDPVQPQAVQRLQKWLGQGYQADMAWMENPRRQDLRQVMPEVRSVISLGLNYYTPHPRPQGVDHGKISRYGWGRDYHRILHQKLKTLARWLEAQEPGIKTRYYGDTGPVQDKVWAQQAGLGWVGKHSNVITRDYGSWIFLGEILTNLPLEPDRPHTDHCGTCTRCLEACPTQAIVEPFVVDANRCIAYHTIENRAEQLPTSITPHLQGWVAGCDICQEVCPWNQRFAQETDIAGFQPYPHNVAPTLEELAHLSEADYEERFRASALRRIKLPMLRRNARANLQANSADLPLPQPPTP
jgi:epoxyqueuosine reductase